MKQPYILYPLSFVQNHYRICDLLCVVQFPVDIPSYQ